MKTIKSIIIILGLFSFCSCTKKVNKDAFITFKDNKIPVYSKTFIEDLILDTNVNFENYQINTDTIGETKIDFYYTYENQKYNYEKIIEIVDDEKPKIFGGANKTVMKGYSGNLCSLVMYGDNYDSEPLCIIEGDYDINKTGDYKIKIIVTDASGNSNNHNINLKVVEKNNNSNNIVTLPKYAFSDALKDYKNDSNELGIDVSEWQGLVDYKKIKNAGATFVMMRIGYTPTSGETPKMDGTYKNNIKRAKEAGLKVGVYLYSKALSKEHAVKEAKWILTELDGESLDFPIIFDWEIWDNWNSYHLSFHELNLMPKAFIETVEKAGYKGALYGSKFYLENLWDGSYDSVWLAHYTNKTNYKGNYFMWQFSNTGKIDGIYGDVDMNILTGKEYLG